MGNPSSRRAAACARVPLAVALLAGAIWSLPPTALSASVLSLLAPMLPEAPALERTFVVGRIAELHVLDGRPQSETELRQRLRRSVRFRFQAPHVIVIENAEGREDLYPLQGRFNHEGASASFVASKRLQDATSLVESSWTGQLDLTREPFVLSLEVRAASILSASSATSHYRAVLELAPR